MFFIPIFDARIEKICKKLIFNVWLFELSGSTFSKSDPSMSCIFFMDVNGGWAEWAIDHPGFDRIEGAAGQRLRAALLLAHPALDSYLRPCF